MRRPTLIENWRGGSDRTVFPRARAFGTAAGTSGWQRAVNVLSPESVFRLILAFGLATALWLFVTSKAPQGSYPFPQPIPVSPVGIGSGLTVANNLPAVRVSVGSSVDAIIQPPGSFEAHVDLSGLGPGIHARVPVVLKGPVRIVGWSPRMVAVDIERIVTKSVPVKVSVVKPPPFGFTLRPGSVSTNPPAVKVTGARTLVDPIAQALVSVSLSGVTGAVDRDYTPLLVNAVGRHVTSRLLFTPSVVTIHASIFQESTRKSVPVVTSINGSPAAGFAVKSFNVSPASVVVFGPQRRLATMRNVVTPAISVRDLTGGSHTFEISLRRPSNVSFSISKVRLTVVVRSIDLSQVLTLPVIVVGARGGAGVQVKPGAVSVTVLGRASRLAAAARDSRVTVDARGLSRATHIVRIHVRVPNGVQILAVQPASVSVSVRR